MLTLENDNLKFKLEKEVWDEICFHYKPLESFKNNIIIKKISNIDWTKGYITLTFKQVDALLDLFSLTYGDLNFGIRQVVKDRLVLRSTKFKELSEKTHTHTKFHISRASLFRDKFIELREEIGLPRNPGRPNITIDNIKNYLKLDSQEYRKSTSTFTKNSKIFYLRKKIESLGCLVFETESKKLIDPKEVSGMFVWYDSWPIIILNSNMATYYQRSIFTLMHELYHFLVTRKSCESGENLIVTGDNFRIEERANEFAIDCLFPESVYRNVNEDILVDLMKLLKWLKSNLKEFGISEQAQVRKLREKQIISEDIYNNWKHDYEKRIFDNKNKQKGSTFGRWPKWRESSIGRLKGISFINLAFRAYIEEDYSLSRLSGFLDVRTSSVEDVFDYWLY